MDLVNRGLTMFIDSKTVTVVGFEPDVIQG